jgi:hypothetical protein
VADSINFGEKDSSSQFGLIFISSNCVNLIQKDMIFSKRKIRVSILNEFADLFIDLFVIVVKFH